MTIDRREQRPQRPVRIGIVVGAGLALAMTVLRVVNLGLDHTDGFDPGEMAGSVAMGVAVGLPAIYAWLSMDRKPGLLWAGVFGAVLAGLYWYPFFLPWLAVAILWGMAAGRSPAGGRNPARAIWHRFVLLVLMVAALFALFIHLDPACTETLADGTVRSVDPSARGFETGWVWGATGTQTGSSGSGPEVVASACTSDRIVIGEALASLALSATAITLARRWPVTEPEAARARVS